MDILLDIRPLGTTSLLVAEDALAELLVPDASGG